MLWMKVDLALEGLKYTFNLGTLDFTHKSIVIFHRYIMINPTILFLHYFFPSEQIVCGQRLLDELY